MPAEGSDAISLSATAARNTDRMMTCLVLMVVGASVVLIVFTQDSMWERLIDRSGRSANGTEPATWSAFSRVDGTQI